MANIPLLDIEFPGLPDKYTFPAVDDTLTTTGAAADAKKTGDEITNLKQDLNDISEGGTGYIYTPITYDSINFDRTRQGIRFIQKVDGTVDVSGTNDGTGNSRLGLLDANGIHFFSLSACKTYRLSGCPANGSLESYYLNIRKSTGGSLFIEYGEGVVFSPPDDNLYQVVVSVASGYAVSGTITFTPLLEEVTETQSALTAVDQFARKGLGLFNNKIVTPQMFGALGNGTNDDSQAVSDADTSNANAVYFPPGVYNVSNVVSHKSWIMADDAWITTTTANGTVITIAGNKNTYKLNCRFRNINPYWGIDVTGDYNHIEQLVVDGMEYDGNTQPYGSCALMFHGNYNTVDFARFQDFTQSSSGNDSAPQCIATLDNATGNYFADVYSYNCRAAFVNASGAGTINSAGVIKTIAAHDNGVYNVRGGHVDIGTLDHDGNDEGFVVITDSGQTLSSANVGTLICKNCAVAIRIKNSGQVKIGQAFIMDCGLGIRLDLNNVESESLIINSFQMFGKMLKPIYASADGLRGVLDHLRIDKLYVKHDSAASGASANDFLTYLDVSAVGELYIGQCDIDFIADESVYQNTNPVKLILSSAPAKRSFVGYSKIVSSRHDLLITPIGQSSMTIKNGLITQDGIKVDKEGLYDSNIFASAAPQSGTWKKGQRISSTDTSVAEYVCTASGTPGTWKTVQLA